MVPKGLMEYTMVLEYPLMSVNYHKKLISEGLSHIELKACEGDGHGAQGVDGVHHGVGIPFIEC